MPTRKGPVECGACRGTGLRRSRLCEACGGYGRLPAAKSPTPAGAKAARKRQSRGASEKPRVVSRRVSPASSRKAESAWFQAIADTDRMTFEHWMQAHEKECRLAVSYEKAKQQWLQRAYDLFVSDIVARGGKPWSFESFQARLQVSYPSYRSWCQDEYLGYRAGWRGLYGRPARHNAAPRRKK